MDEPVNGNPEQGQEQTTQTSWYGDSYKDVVAKKGWKSPDDALKSYSELEKSMGNRVRIPAPDAKPEELRAFYSKIGVPESVEGYEIDEIPEGSFRDESIENHIKQIALDSGISKNALANIMKGYYQHQVDSLKESREQGEQTLRTELGQNYDVEMTIAKRFCDNCSDDFRELLDSTGIGNNPIFIKEFIKLGKMTQSDKLIKGDTSGDENKVYSPKYPDSPEMYRNGEDADSKQAREYFVNKGYTY